MVNTLQPNHSFQKEPRQIQYGIGVFIDASPLFQKEIWKNATKQKEVT
jgi:hypothetical protein